MNLSHKLVLGTVQFGLNYGINNRTGQVSQSEVETILKLCDENGINTLDTSSAYGNSENVIGKIFAKERYDFHIVSKFPQSEQSVEKALNVSLNQLNQNSLYGYLIHHFDFYRSHPGIWNEMQVLKEQGKIEKIGFSLYTVSELLYLLENKVKFDILQFPYNLFDRQFEPYLKELKDRGVEIHTRSVFLQGLFFKNVSSLNKKLLPLKFYLEKLHHYCHETGISIERLALDYVLCNEYIDGVLIGVDSTNQLLENVKASRAVALDFDFVNSLHVREKDLLNPTNW